MKNKQLTFDEYRNFISSNILAYYRNGLVVCKQSFILIAFDTETESKPNIALTFSCMAKDAIIEYSIESNEKANSC